MSYFYALDLRLNADDVTAAPSGGFEWPKMLKENQERIAWFDNYQPDRTNETHRTSNCGTPLRKAATVTAGGRPTTSNTEKQAAERTANALAGGAPERSRFLEGAGVGALLAETGMSYFSLAPICGSHRFRQRHDSFFGSMIRYLWSERGTAKSVTG